jgi:hypothetical protein
MTNDASNNVRHFTRVKITLGAELMYDNKAFPVWVQDISLGGAYIETKLPLRMDEFVELRIFLNNPEHTIEVSGRIAWVKGDGNGLGIEFSQLKPFDIWALIRQTQIDPKEVFQLPSDRK